MDRFNRLEPLHRFMRNRGFIAGLTVLALSGVAATSAALGTVLSTPDQHLWTLGASETAVSSWDGNRLLTMTFNADDHYGLVQYANNSRQVYPGAGGAGFATYDANNKVVKYSDAPMVMRPPSGWSVLWGDPSIVRNRADQTKLYQAQLGVPSSKFPSSGMIVGSMDSGGSCGSFLGGACISRSTDGGQTFTTSANDCMRRITSSCPNGTFYDGSDMTSSPEGRVYAAFNDVTRSRIDIYMATSPTGGFARLPGFNVTSALHPRLRYGSDGGLYVLFEDANNELMLARYNGGSSNSGTWTTHAVEGSSGITNGGADVVLSDRAIRMGPEYDFDVGLDDDGSAQIRIVFVLRNGNGKHFIKAVRCTMGTSISCAQPSAWNTASTAGDQWGPAIAFGFHALTGKVAWYISYYSRQNNANGNTAELWGAEITDPPGTSSLTPFNLESAQIPCPDIRDLSHPNTVGGYWGDYDHMAGTISFMWRGFTDSSHATCQRQMFHSTTNYAALSMWSIL
jgi:hypothetical protein